MPDSAARSVSAVAGGRNRRADDPPDPRAAPAAAGIRVCASADLAESGRAQLFDVLLWGQPARAFVLRHAGRAVAYINRCAHVPAELDWIPGEFLDHDRQVIVCTIHGAEYDPASGRCLGGPCGRGSLLTVTVKESDEQVYWYPSRDVRAPAPLAPADVSRTPAVEAIPAVAASDRTDLSAVATQPTCADSPFPTASDASAPGAPESLSP
jgi:nitrite reductase/ring-hydroxylating ferredoxin subunit